jgi:hypothetical protein
VEPLRVFGAAPAAPISLLLNNIQRYSIVNQNLENSRYDCISTTYEHHIAREITEESHPDSQRAKAADSEASLRENLAEQLSSAQNELSSSLIALRSSGDANPSLISQGDAQLGALLALRRQLSQAGPATLAMVRAEITACIASASSVARQADIAIAAGAGPTANLAAASQAARSAVASFNDDFYEKKIFDPYLRFSSAEDEEKYRRDEATRKQEIEKALALHTPAGDLQANKLAIDQLKDAGAHGADQSPEYASRLSTLTATKEALAAQVEKKETPTSSQDRLEAAAAAQPTDAPTLPPEMLAALRNVSLPDQGQTGHGLEGRSAPPEPTLTR